MRFGVGLPQFGVPWSLTCEVAQLCDEAGFDSVWMVDHFVGIPDDRQSVFEPFTAMAAIAAITRRVKLGFQVLCVSFRPPALLAKMAATLDVISGGRLILGIGAGWHEAEYVAYGYEFPSIGTRLAQLDETLAICRAMWTEERATFKGRHFRVEDAPCAPKPVQRRLPVMIGGGGERVLLRLVARHADLWNNMGITHQDVAAKRAVLAAHCRSIGRDPAEIEVTQQTVAAIAEGPTAARQATEKVLAELPFLVGDRELAITGTPDECRRRVGKSRELGIDHLIMALGRRPDPEALRLFAREVIPAFR